MSVPNNARMGQHATKQDNMAKSLTERMGQTPMTIKKISRGLFTMMGQGAKEKTPSGVLKAGKNAPSITRSMNQGGK